MIFVIDSGNSYSKIGQFVDGKLIKIYQKESFDETIELVQKKQPEKIIVGSVNFSPESLKNMLDGIPIFEIHSTMPVPVKIKYKTPDTLGIDRLAGVICAWERFPKKNILVIDAGTCITYDFIGESGIYYGGGISPGMEIRFKSLSEFTENLPYVQIQENIELIGDSTDNSILSGVVHGIVAEIEGIISKYQDKYEKLTIFMSGGSAFFFESKIKHSIFAFPNMVLLGLYSIYEYNNR